MFANGNNIAFRFNESNILVINWAIILL